MGCLTNIIIKVKWVRGRKTCNATHNSRKYSYSTKIYALKDKLLHKGHGYVKHSLSWFVVVLGS